MAFSDIEHQKIKNKVGGFCSKMTPQHLKDKLRFEYEIENQSVIVYEIRPAFRIPGKFTKMPIAKPSYVKSQNLWKLYWQRASGK